MKNILYLSTPVKLMSEEELTNILRIARKNNSASNVSGILLYSDGTFLQVLEGEDQDVDAIFIRIALDKRHKNITVLIDDELSEKNFANWSMGFNSTAPQKMQEVIGYLKPGNFLNAKDKNSQVANILKTFIDTNKLTVKY